MNDIRNNVILSIGYVDAGMAQKIGEEIADRFELSGRCRNTRSVANRNGDMVLSLRSTCPAETALELMQYLHRRGHQQFDLAFRRKLTEDWIVMQGWRAGNGRPRLSAVDSGFAVTTSRRRKIRLLSKVTLSI
ncbi:MAG: hypothetical protein NC548_29710 [Lachnospiraceae bacterium]|nr:hypothetical protein [Lachnospiraceae bacterium]